MIVAVSACLLGEDCKYNGGNNRHERLVEVLAGDGFTVVPVCPEVLGGLSVPRVPAELVDGRVLNAQGDSVDEEFRRGAREALRIVRNVGATCAVLQPRSPSCGVHCVYDGSFSGVLVSGFGVFARMARDAGLQIFEPDEFLEQLLDA